MIEPVAATALILSILALIAYYLQPEQPHHQRHYYHQVRRSRVMADPQRRSRGGGVEWVAETKRGGGEGEEYEQENEGEGRGAGEWAIGVRRLSMAGRKIVKSRPVQEEGVDAEDENESAAAAESVPESAFIDKVKTHTDATSQAT